MKSYKILGLCVSCVLAFSSVSAYANEKIAFISADSYGELDFSKSSIISFEEKGEMVSKLSEVSSLYQLSISEANTYITGQYGIIISENGVSVYDEASTSGSVIGEVPNNSIILINGTNEDFARILYNDTVGYIENKYIKTTGIEEKAEIVIDQVQETILYAKITAETGLNLRQDATTSSAVLTTLPYGAYATVLSTEQDWVKVQYNGQTGYISSQYVIITDAIETKTTASTTSSELVNFAMQYLGTPYVYGGTNLNAGVDCSGFTYSVFKSFGINLNRTSRDQYLNGTSVAKSDLMPGDLVFFNTGGDTTISHVGIYIGDNQYIHSTDSKNQGVIISSLNSDYSLRTYYGARRVLS